MIVDKCYTDLAYRDKEDMMHDISISQKKIRKYTMVHRISLLSACKI